jgi:hypothetical protein
MIKRIAAFVCICIGFGFLLLCPPEAFSEQPAYGRFVAGLLAGACFGVFLAYRWLKMKGGGE